MTKQNTFLILEDDLEQLIRYKEICEKLDYDVFAFSTLPEAQKYLENKPIDVVLTDIHLNGTEKKNTFEGLQFIAYIKTNHPEVLILAMSNDPKIDTYHRSLAAGAAHFIKKPIVDEHEVALGIETAKDKSTLKRATNAFLKAPKLPLELREKCPDGIVISDKYRALAKKIASYKKLPVTIYGETGTGKEEYAKLIHRERCKIDEIVPFISVNCGNIDDQMAASLIFGHIKGSFTGATATTNGYIGEADGGILFLDEVHCLSKSLQQRLLRVLNDGTYERLGDTKKLKSSFQVISASTKSLDSEVATGNFLLDLQIRLTGHDIELPPLRERQEDIPIFVRLFLAQEGVNVSETEMQKIIKKCKTHYWQGNVRLLHRAIQTLVGMTAMCGEPVTVDALPAWKTMMAPINK